MAPRNPSSIDDTSSADSPLKPKTEKAKVTKVKASKKEKVDGEKVTKPKAVKKEKVVADGEDKEKKFKKAATDGVKKSTGDGKEKVKAVNGEEAIDLIAKYLKEQNRPYSATEVSANLHGKVTKTVADRLLKEMSESGLIMGKATKGTEKGSQWVFWPLQDPANAASPEELAAMDEQIEELKEKVPALKGDLKITTIKLNALKAALTTSELMAVVEKLGRENIEKRDKLSDFKAGEVEMAKKEDVLTVEKEMAWWGKKRKARKQAFEGLEDKLREGMTKEDIWERVGLDEDIEGL